jgi:hypothetical protein
MAGGHDQLGRIVRVRRAECAGFTGYSGVQLTVLGLHREGVNRTLRDGFIEPTSPEPGYESDQR